MVYNEQFNIWVHSGMSGFTSSGIFLEMRESDYYHHRELRSNPIILDVGGHVGIFSLEMAKRYPKGIVLCFEPHPENAEIARRNLKDTYVTVVESAVSYGEHSELLCFKDGSRNSGGSQLVQEGGNPFENDCDFGDRIKVSTKTLEQIVATFGIQQIDLLKLDCEGSEYSILQNASLDIVKEIVGEWHSVPGVPRFDKFCSEHLPGWTLETWGELTGPLGMFRLVPRSAQVCARRVTQ